MLDDDVRELKTMVMGLGGRLDRIETKLEAHDRRFDGIDERLDGIDVRLARINVRLDGIDVRLDGIDVRLTDHDRRFDMLDGRLDGIDGRLDGIDARLDGIDGRLDGIDGRLADHDRRFDTLQREIRDGLAEKGEYVDLRHKELTAEMRTGFASVRTEFGDVRLLITNQFVRAAEHADRLYGALRIQTNLQGEHQDALFRRQEDLDQRVLRLQIGRIT